MGIFVQDTLELENGVSINNYYVRVREIDIINHTNYNGVFQLVGICDFYATKEAREAEKDILKYDHVSISSEIFKITLSRLVSETHIAQLPSLELKIFPPKWTAPHFVRMYTISRNNNI